jgi:hypothetical protein
MNGERRRGGALRRLLHATGDRSEAGDGKRELGGKDMMFWRQVGSTLVLTVAIQLLFVRDAQAYLDPGTMSLIFQMIVASILGALVALKVYWRRVSANVRGLLSSKKEEEEEEA